MLARSLFLFMALFFASIVTTQSAWAQFTEDDVTADDTYDPFADYSEFEASADEEADIHFFRNGRFFNFAFMLGGRFFTSTLGQLNSPAPVYGMNMTYFFDIRTALQVSFTHGEHKFNLNSGTNSDGDYPGLSGNNALTSISIDMKYYFNTANITRGFADLNPYIIGGFSVNHRTIKFAAEDVLIKSSPNGVQLGAGLEVPIARNKMYLAFQAMYNYVNFPDENEQIQTTESGLQTQHPTHVYPRGDFVEGYLILGINF
ncbi:MAG: outer membrane beta-barrel protein [Bdellovibrionaceae bacterium]|nr:outer membrane beta-barrel protein [Pseudobdellovibrionaceae bacterium]